MRRRALFLDRDGVINEDTGYVGRHEHFTFIDGIFDLVASAKARGFLVVVVTNQAGIGRGYYTEADFHSLMQWVNGRFLVQGGVLDKIYFCPSHPEHGVGAYRRESPFRKPAPGMLQAAIRELGIDPSRSVLIGDKMTDIEAGRAAGVAINLLFRPEAGESYQPAICHLNEAETYLGEDGCLDVS